MPEEAHFVGQAVSVWTREPAQGAVLEHVSVKQLGARAFLVGELPDDGESGDPRVGLTMWFPVDDVIMLTVYPDVQSARAAYAARKKQAAPTGRKIWQWWW